MWLTDLADVLRAAGLEVVEVEGWQTRGAKRLDNGRRELTDVLGLTAHHTATPWTRAGDYPSLATVRDGRSDVPGPLAQLGLGRSGTWYVIAAGYAHHAGVSLEVSMTSAHTIGVEAEAAGTGDPRDWPDVQYRSYARGMAALSRNYGVPNAHVRGHKETAAPLGRKIDPSFDMTRFRAEVLSATTQEDDVTPEQDAKLARIVEINEALVKYILDPAGRGKQADDRVLGVLPNRRFPGVDGQPGPVAMVLDQLDGQVLRQDIEAVAVTLTDEQLAALTAILGPELAGHVIGSLAGMDVATVIDTKQTVSSTLIPAV